VVDLDAFLDVRDVLDDLRTRPGIEGALKDQDVGGVLRSQATPALLA
jgi:hypothetical protein